MIKYLSILVLCASAFGSDYFEYYPVSGDTISEIRESMDKERPHGYDAYCRWFIEPSGHVDTIITLPRHTALGDLSIRVLEEWTRYVKALTDHEIGHRDIAHFAAGLIKKGREYHKTLAECRYRQRRYDRKSKHGKPRELD